VSHIAQWAGCSDSFVTKCCRRVMLAIASLHNCAIHWPAPAEKAAVSDWVEAHSCPAWRPGFCMVDGTLIPLYCKPAHFGAQFFDRKCNYSLGLHVCVHLPSANGYALRTDGVSAYQYSRPLHHRLCGRTNGQYA
jgi:hypothetical protein